MPEAQVPEGKYSVIIMSAEVIRFEKTGSVAVCMEMSVTRGEHSYKRCEKKLFFQSSELQLAKSRFYRLGGELLSFDTLEDAAHALVGNQLIVSVAYTELGRQRVSIYEYIGKGNPNKFI